MESSKLKNIILIVLLMVNLVFAGLLVNSWRESKKFSEQARESLESVLAGRGIELSAEVDINVVPPAEYELRRDLESELAAVRAILGTAEAYDRGGNVYYYSGQNGEARFRGTGEIELSLSDGASDFKTSPESAAKKAARLLGLDAFLISSDGGGEFAATTTTLGWRWQDCEVFNGRLSFSLTEAGLLSIEGQRGFDEVCGVTGAEAMDCQTAIMRFLSIMDENGVSFSEIQAVDAGFVLRVSVSGEETLSPAWRISADSGVYCINAVTGREEKL